MSRGRSALPLRHAAALGLLQGPTELLPVSSSAHTMLTARLAGWGYEELDDELRKSFEVALHGGAGLALALAMGGSLRRQVAGAERRALVLLALASAPPALAGLLLGRVVERRLGGPRQVAFALAAGAVAMALADAEAPDGRDLRTAGARDALAVGCAQAAALVPGISRSGAVLTVARSRGFAREAAQVLCWTAALPVIAGAGALQAARQLRSGIPEGFGSSLLTGAASAFLSTLVSAGLLRGSLARAPLLPFSLYRLLLAIAVLARERRLAWGISKRPWPSSEG